MPAALQSSCLPCPDLACPAPPGGCSPLSALRASMPRQMSDLPLARSAGLAVGLWPAGARAHVPPAAFSCRRLASSASLSCPSTSEPAPTSSPTSSSTTCESGSAACLPGLHACMPSCTAPRACLLKLPPDSRPKHSPFCWRGCHTCRCMPAGFLPQQNRRTAAAARSKRRKRARQPRWQTCLTVRVQTCLSAAPAAAAAAAASNLQLQPACLPACLLLL